MRSIETIRPLAIAAHVVFSQFGRSCPEKGHFIHTIPKKAHKKYVLPMLTYRPGCLHPIY